MTNRPDDQALPADDLQQPDQPPAPAEESHARGNERRLWYVPDNALSDEEIEAMNAALDPDEEPSPTPADTVSSGDWHAPAQAEEAVETVLDEDFVGGIQPATQSVPDVFDAEQSTSDTPDEPETGAEESPEVPEAPLDSGDGDFRQPPQGVAAEQGLGGLRDQSQAAADDQPAEPDVPARGFGGVSDSQQQGTPDPEATRALSDTGQLGGQPGQQVGDQTPRPSQTEPLQGQQPGPQAGAHQPQQPSQPGGYQQPPQQASQQQAAPNPQAQRFRAVEQAVAQLREQYAHGQLSRPQLEAELRKRIILDEQGRWWTIGIDSNRWYRYDGREWIPDTPPQTGPMAAVGGQQPQQGQPVRGNYVPTETSVQQPPAQAEAGQAQPGQEVELDDYGVPLPQKVPLEDPQATMVNLNVATGSNEEATWGATQSSQPSPQAQDTIPSPGDQPRVSSKEAAAAVYDDQTVATPTRQAPDAAEPYTDYDYQDAAVQKPKKDDVQPNYSDAYGRTLERSNLIKYSIWAGIGGVVLTLGIVLCGLLGMVGYYFSVVNQYNDRIENLGQRAASFQSTRIFDANGNVLAQYNDPDVGARTEVALADVSPWIIHATIATEDETFYENPGFSVFAILRAVYTNLSSEGPRSGASTITQQLVRATLLDEGFATELSPERKVTEIILAAELNRQYTKNEILELYLNEIYYGNLAYGIEAAAQVYFDKSASDVNIFEAAFLAGLPQAPATYDPVRNRNAALGRMNTVLRLMAEANDTGCVRMQHDTNAEGFDLSQPLCITQAELDGPEFAVDKAVIETTLFEPPSFQPRYGHFVNWIWAHLEEQYDVNEIYEIGFNVYTTLEPDLQNAAQLAIDEQLVFARQRGFSINNGAVVVMDPRTGAVRAMVGSADFNNEDIDGQVNVLISPQQPGSSIKPLVYLTALEGVEGDYWTPATIIWDTQSCWSGGGAQPYCPTNFDQEFRGPVSVRRALANSLNVPAVKTMDFISPSNFEERVEELGLSFPLQNPGDAGLPSALGAVEVRPLDLVSVYSIFANQGQRFVPYGIERIETANGDVIFQHTPEVIGLNVRSEHAFLLNNILSDDEARAEEFGRGSVLTLPDRQVAAKTGTTNDNRDALTIGWTPQVITGVWFGNTDNSPTGGATGFSIAAPVWNRVMQVALQNEPSQPFNQPQGITQMQVCVDTGAQVPQDGCGPGGSRTELFFANQPPPPPEESLIETVNIDPWTGLRANEFCPDYAVTRSFLTVDDGTALEWLRNNPRGQQWAQARGIDVSQELAAPPEGACEPGQERPQINIASPADGQSFDVGALIGIEGTATAPNFEYYELQYAPASTPDNFTTISRRSAASSGTLGQLDTLELNLPPGQYILRLVVRGTIGVEADDRAQITLVGSQPESESDDSPFPTATGEAVPQGETG